MLSLFSDLAHAKALFQQSALLACMGIHPDTVSATPPADGAGDAILSCATSVDTPSGTSPAAGAEQNPTLCPTLSQPLDDARSGFPDRHRLISHPTHYKPRGQQDHG